MSCWPRFVPLAAALSAVVLTVGCAEAPFVMTDYRYHQRGSVSVCFNERTTTVKDAKVLADEICRQYERTSQLSLIQSYQCSWTAPTQASFTCVARPGETPPPFVEHLSPMRHDPSLGPM